MRLIPPHDADILEDMKQRGLLILFVLLFHKPALARSDGDAHRKTVAAQDAAVAKAGIGHIDGEHGAALAHREAETHAHAGLVEVVVLVGDIEGEAAVVVEDAGADAYASQIAGGRSVALPFAAEGKTPVVGIAEG